MLCDAYGHQVGLAALPGAPFTDAIAHELWRILMDGGRRARVSGVEPEAGGCYKAVARCRW